MAVHKLANTAGTLVDFTDTAKYRAMRDGASYMRPQRRVLIPMYSGTSLYSYSFADTKVFRWRIACLGATYNTALANATAIDTALSTARLFEATGAGTQVQYTEQFHDQSSASVFHVLDGEFNFDDRDFVAVGKLRGTLTLYVTID